MNFYQWLTVILFYVAMALALLLGDNLPAASRTAILICVCVIFIASSPRGSRYAG